jgi:hypothetical protein
VIFSPLPIHRRVKDQSQHSGKSRRCQQIPHSTTDRSRCLPDEVQSYDIRSPEVMEAAALPSERTRSNSARAIVLASLLAFKSKTSGTRRGAWPSSVNSTI